MSARWLVSFIISGLFVSNLSQALDILTCGSNRALTSSVVRHGEEIDFRIGGVSYHGPYDMGKLKEANATSTRCNSLLDGRVFFLKFSGLKVGWHGTKEGALFTYLGMGRVEGKYYGVRVGANPVLGGSAAVFGTNGGIATYTGLGIGAFADVAATRVEVVPFIEACLKEHCSDVEVPVVCKECPKLGGLGPVSLGHKRYQHDWMALVIGEQKKRGYLVNSFWIPEFYDPNREIRHESHIKFEALKRGEPANLVSFSVFDGGKGLWMIDEYGRFVLYFHIKGEPYFAMAHGLNDSPYLKLRDTKIERYWYFFDSDMTIEAKIFDRQGNWVGHLNITD